MIFANIVRLCDKHKISIAKLERETDIGNGTIARWNNSSPRVDSLQKVANYFGVTVDELLSVDEQKQDSV